MKPLLKQHFSRVSRIHFCNDGKCLLFYNPDALCYKKEVLCHMHVISLCKLYSTYLILTKTVMGERHDLVH